MTISSSSSHFNGRVRSFKSKSHRTAHEAHQKKFTRHYQFNRPKTSIPKQTLPIVLPKKAKPLSKLKGLSLQIGTNSNPLKEKQLTPPAAPTGDKLDFSFKNAAFPSPKADKFEFPVTTSIDRTTSRTFPLYPDPESPKGMNLVESQGSTTKPEFGVPTPLVKRHTTGSLDLSRTKSGGISKKEVPLAQKPRHRRKNAMTQQDLIAYVNSGVATPNTRTQELFSKFKIRESHDAETEKSPSPFRTELVPDSTSVDSPEPSKVNQQTDPELNNLLFHW